jgi:hypothetical protein
MTKKTNILSYFIKDIKDPIECSFYEQTKYEDTITILYKGELIFMSINNLVFKFIYNICIHK